MKISSKGTIKFTLPFVSVFGDLQHWNLTNCWLMKLVKSAWIKLFIKIYFQLLILAKVSVPNFRDNLRCWKIGKGLLLTWGPLLSEFGIRFQEKLQIHWIFGAISAQVRRIYTAAHWSSKIFIHFTFWGYFWFKQAGFWLK